MLSRFKHHQKLWALGLAILCTVTPNTAAMAQASGVPWSAQPGLIAPEAQQRYAERYPSIKGPEDLENLLEEVGRHQPVARLEARWKNGTWLLVGTPAMRLTDVDVVTVTRFLRAPLVSAVQNYLGQVDSPELQAKVKSTLESYLKRRGYPLAKASLKVEPADDGAVYTVTIDEGQPCVIDRIELGFRLPQGVRLEMHPGDLCDRELVDKAMSDLETALRDKGYNQLRIDLGEIAYHPETNTQTIVVSGVLGQKVHYEIVDAQKRFLIDELFADDELTKVDPTLIGPDSMAAELARRYRNRGFLDVEVKGPEIRRGSEDEFIYVFRVEPGTQYFLRGVTFEGNSVFTEKELLDTMNLEGFLQRTPPYNPEEIQSGISAIRGRYQAKGYWDVKVRDPGSGQKDKDTGSVRMTIQIEEGLQRTLTDVKVSGNEAVPTAEIRAMLTGEEGKLPEPDVPLDRSELVDFQQKVRTAYINKGYLSAEVSIELQAQAQRRQVPTTVLVNVREGPRVRIGDVTVVGLVRTDPKVVRRELSFESGEWYDPEKIAQSRQSLTRLGLFRSVQIVPGDRTPISDKVAELDLVVDVREGKAGSVTFGPGWSLGKGWNYETEAAYNNLSGVGRQISVRGAISEEKNQKAIGRKTLVGRKIGAGYLEPWIFDLPIDMSISANQKAEWGGELWELSYGGELALIHKLRTFFPGSTVSTFYGQKVARTEGPDRLEDSLVANDVRIGSIGVRYNLDQRNDLRFPSSGYTLDTELAWARYGLGGNLRYFRWDVSHSIYFGILEDLLFAVNTGLTSYESVERKDAIVDILPPSERLYAGGSESIRGYRPRSLGPVVRGPELDLNEATGDCKGIKGIEYKQLDGTRRVTLRQDLRYRFTDNFALTGFVDSGTVFLDKRHMQRFREFYAANPVYCGTEVAGYRSVEDNVGYEFPDLIKHPGYLLSRHYTSYGLAGNMLTALGSVNLGYGLPWREPKTERCDEDASYCLTRGKQGGHWITRGEFYLNVGARF